MPPSTGRSARGDVPPADPRMPGAAIGAVVLGFVGALPPAFVAFFAVALGGLTADAGPDPWTYLLLAVPVVQAVAAVLLLARRAWLPTVLAVLPVGLFTGGVIWAAAQAAEPSGLGWPLLLLVAPVGAAVLAATARVRRWVAGRPRRGR
ncbi:hypothetical protein [Geodermatophilus marinus]|uniref:hypothetical protein n=1 Tax=Geodermatophilus sp. LHW52908 TaxID=2303986 RepID=UPI000E3CA5A0|nr:hypothetical protein [Geodermatophilus sp. LHW52908]RFU22620.1 hypothetical protein D0Z06_05150 [Geodermatophilus sp. LHW52908]